MYKAVMIDFDGTLADTLPLCYEAFIRAGKDVAGKAIPREDVAACFGPSEEGMMRRLLPDYWEEGLSAYLSYYRELHDMCPEPFAGARELLELLRRHRVPLALITGKGSVSAAISLERYGLARCFDWIATGNAEGSQKDKHMREFTAAQGIAPEDAVYIGDSVADIRESRKAGVDVFAAGWAATAKPAELEAEGPDRLFTDINDLRTYFEQELDALR